MKRCPGCDKEQPRSNFVTVYGHPSPRAKYCESCFRKHQQDHVRELMDGRNFCLYCGKKVESYCDYSPEGRSIKTYVHRDHMDPLSLGGYDNFGIVDLETGDVSTDDRNLVYCCTECNLTKGDMPFVEWLATLKPENQELARAVYAEKHDGKKPEEFVPEISEIRIVIGRDGVVDETELDD